VISALGVVETIGTETSFASEVLKPAVPGISGASAGVAGRRALLNDVQERLSMSIRDGIAYSLQSAEASVAAARTSTTLAALAQAHQAAADYDTARKYATEALDLVVDGARRGVTDAMATKVALEVLLSGPDAATALDYAGRLSLSEYLKLEVATTLAGIGRFDEAHRYIAASNAPQRDAVLGYLLTLQGNYPEAVPPLRSALRANPSDADSALNLSIALSQVGSEKKAVSAALQARNAAPGRIDVAVHLLDLLLEIGDLERAERELKSITTSSSQRGSRLMVVEARIKLAQGDYDRAIRLLERAAQRASDESDVDAEAEVRSNLVHLRVIRGDLDRDAGFNALVKLSREMPASDVVVANLAQVSWRVGQAPALAERFSHVEQTTEKPRSEFIQYELATLRGENERASVHALEWLRLEPKNPRAATAALVALGIGEERWNEAAQLALRVAKLDGGNGSTLNNAAYVLAMAGMGERAVEIISPFAEESYIYKATLGLAHLACGHIELGMKLYRRAADEAETSGDDSRSLMTAYQALVVRQLGVMYAADTAMVTALSLPPYPLPEDWEDKPEFVRLRNVAVSRGFGWPLEL
jgi:tetratricopeptide (TPR) repeat protein